MGVRTASVAAFHFQSRAVKEVVRDDVREESEVESEDGSSVDSTDGIFAKRCERGEGEGEGKGGRGGERSAQKVVMKAA